MSEFTKYAAWTAWILFILLGIIGVLVFKEWYDSGFVEYPEEDSDTVMLQLSSTTSAEGFAPRLTS